MPPGGPLASVAGDRLAQTGAPAVSAKPVFALIDCNNFFVSCERVFRPDLRGQPVAVLSNNDGCIVARSNEVKAMGIGMGVPLFKVRGIVEKGKVTLFSGNFGLYGDFSQRVVQVLQTISPDIEVYSVDESFLEISRLHITDYAGWARTVRDQVEQLTGIPVSVGVAPSKTLAKAAAEYAKKTPQTGGAYSVCPDGHVSPAQADQLHRQLLAWLPIGEVWGIGWRTAPKLRQYGLTSAAQLARVSDEWAHQHLNILGYRTVKELQGTACYGLEVNGEPQQSIARTRQFGHTIRSGHELQSAIATFTAQAAVKLRRQGEVAGAVAVFLRTPHRQTEQHGGSTVVRLPQPSADTGTLITAALQGLEVVRDPDFSYKSGGVVLLDLRPRTAWQLSFWGKNSAQLDRSQRLMQSVDELNQKYGTRLVRHASESPVHATWHSRRSRRSPRYTTEWTELPVVKAR